MVERRTTIYDFRFILYFWDGKQKCARYQKYAHLRGYYFTIIMTYSYDNSYATQYHIIIYSNRLDFMTYFDVRRIFLIQLRILEFCKKFS